MSDKQPRHHNHKSPNPLQRSKTYVHLPLVLLSTIFLLPLLWLVMSSLQPREQVGKNPPEWLPRQHFIHYQSPHLEHAEKVYVTPPEELGIAKVEVKMLDGPHTGQQLLFDTRFYQVRNQQAYIRKKVQIADSFVAKEFPVELIANYAASDVYLKRWESSKTRSSNSHNTNNNGNTERQWFCVNPESVKVEIQPVWGNYPEAIRALTAGEQDKKLPLGELLAKSSTPFTSSTSNNSQGTTITFLSYLFNTLLVAVLSVIGTVFSSSLVAYGLSRIQWRGSNTLFIITLATMMIPFPVLMIPLYSVFRELGWIGTLMPLWVPAFFGSAFNIFLLRQFFLTIPREISDAARIDGCSEFGIYWRIMLPLAKPALAVVALFQFLFSWNDFLGPMIFLTEPSTFTMSLGLQQYQSQHGGSEWHLLMAASVLLVIPIVILFFFTQKTFIQGIATTGSKG